MQVRTGSFGTNGVPRYNRYGGNGILETKPGSANNSGTYGNKNGARFGKGDRQGLKCDFCGKPGHVKSSCYRLIGWPNPNQKNYHRGRFRTSNVYMQDSIEEGETPLGLDKAQGTNESDGTLYCFNALEFSSDDIWIVDSGASTHMAGNIKKFKGYKHIDKLTPVQLPDNSIKMINCIGSIELGFNLVLEVCLYVASFKYNLLSLSQLSKAANVSFNFYPKFCLLQDFKTQKLLAVARETKDLYLLGADSFSTDTLKKFAEISIDSSNVVSSAHIVNIIVENKVSL
ncbi:hypothetical protein LIER_36929 [Lithospermum erythrorhizon]|uniref:CCHC-type domain-containing protein n=1 Tax=Lithospermum erythrorhizon TaxID=34254 RepID=A0AAV3PGZ0_LITER